MGSLPYHSPQISLLPCLVVILFLLLVFFEQRRQRAQREKNSADLRWFSELHLFSRALAESPDPQQMVDKTTQRTIDIFGSVDCYIFVQTAGSDAFRHLCAQGLSAQTVEQLSGEPLRSYLASCGERWGNLLVFPDLSRPSLGVAWQRDALFRTARGLHT